MKNYKLELEAKFPNLDFTKFNATKSSEFGLVMCSKHGEIFKQYSELIRQKFGCRYCADESRVKGKLIIGDCKKHGKYTYKRGSSKNCPQCLKDSKLYPISDFIKILNKNNLKLVSTYEGLYKTITVRNKYGELKLTANSIRRGQVPTIKSAVDKTSYALNEFKCLYGDKYTYPNFKYVDSKYKFEVVCKEHGTFYTNYTNHKLYKCVSCAYSELDIGFTKEDFIRISNGRLCKLYLIESVSPCGKNFIKVGITCRSIKVRLNKLKFSVLHELSSNDAGYIFDCEKHIHNKYKKYRETFEVKFNGYTECYNICIKDKLIDELTRI